MSGRRGARLGVFVLLALASAALFVRLGFWQLSRRQERKARNAYILARLNAPPVDWATLPADTEHAHYRRVRVAGAPDYEHELALATRTYRGSPGVYLLTPVRTPGHDTAVLVNRGWVYSPDGATVDFARWHDRDSVFTGYVEVLSAAGGGTYTGRPRILTRLSATAVAHALPYPVAPVYVVALGDSPPAPDRAARLEVPPLDEGPHLNYAIQWFAFALVAVVGAIIVATKRGGGSRGAGDAY